MNTNAGPSSPLWSDAREARRRVRDFLDRYDGSAFPNLIQGLADGYETRTLYASDLRLLLDGDPWWGGEA